MAETLPDTLSTGDDPKPTQTPDQITRTGKIVAGILLIFFLLAPIVFIIGYWPDRIAGPKEGLKPLYIHEPFHVRLACVPDTPCCADTFFIRCNARDTAKIAASETTKTASSETAKTVESDSAKLKADSERNKGIAKLGKPDTAVSGSAIAGKRYLLIKDLLDLNIIILALVAVAGFLGNMIHIATSFTAFIGAEKFRRSWILWYCIKPFTAAALAMGLYFVFRGGFLNYTADASGINLYGVLTIAILAGLFTDKATLKLGEVFEVIFALKKVDGKPADPRPNPLVSPAYKFNGVHPDKLSRTENNTITITGENFDKGKLSFTMNGESVAADKITITAGMITLQYMIQAAQAALTQFVLLVTDDQGKTVFTRTFGV